MPAPLSPDTPFQDVVRVRPLFAEKISSYRPDFWERPQAPLREFFPGQADLLEALIQDAIAGAVPGADSLWTELSAAHLLDHLTQNHREFFGVLLADMQRLFEARTEAREVLEDEIETLRGDLARFAGELRARVEGDERELFPRVLRYEASLRDPRVDPEFNGGSLRKAVAYRTAAARRDPVAELETLLARLAGTEAARAGDPWLSLLEERLTELRDRLDHHERLKAEVLYPMALEAEKTLYNLSIRGGGRRAAAVA